MHPASSSLRYAADRLRESAERILRPLGESVASRRLDAAARFDELLIHHGDGGAAGGGGDRRAPQRHHRRRAPVHVRPPGLSVAIGSQDLHAIALEATPVSSDLRTTIL